MLTLADHIEVIQKDIDPSLISSENMNRIKQFARQFPYDITRDHGFESHLGEDGSWADYLFCVKRDSTGAYIMAGHHPKITIPRSFFDKSEWNYIRRFAQEWISTVSFFHRHVKCIWLEYDQKEGYLAEVPKLFLGIDFPSANSQIDLVAFSSELCKKIAETFFQHVFSLKLQENISRCLSALPREARLYHTGFYLNEFPSSVRMVLVGLQPDNLPGYLRQIYWTGDVSKVENMLNELRGRSDYVVYDIDIGEDVLPNLGIEMYFKDFKQSSREPRWESNFDWMVRKGWCLPEKRDGLLNYSGQHAITHFYTLHYLNSLNHLKITYQKPDITRVKAYFGTYIRESRSLIS